MQVCTESIDGVCFTLEIKPGVMTATGDKNGPKEEKQYFPLGQRLKYCRSMKSPQENTTLPLQRTEIRALMLL